MQTIYSFEIKPLSTVHAVRLAVLWWLRGSSTATQRRKLVVVNLWSLNLIIHPSATPAASVTASTASFSSWSSGFTKSPSSTSEATTATWSRPSRVRELDLYIQFF